MDLEAIRAVANAVLYEGYMLYPYRPSALKNRSQGWSFGTLAPEAYAASHPGEASRFQAQVLVTGAGAQFSGEVRFLQLTAKQDARSGEAVERAVHIPEATVESLAKSRISVPFAFSDGPLAGHTICGSVHVSAERVEEAAKITVSVENQSAPALSWETREEALQQALVSAHAIVSVTGGEFVSLLDPPERFRTASVGCQQVGVFPVLAGAEGERSAMLLSPIILYDYPKIAGDSKGDFFDSLEIDEILTLRVLTLTDAEKEEIRAAGPRVRDLLQRTERLSNQDILDLHGMVRSVAHSEDKE